MMDQSDLVIFSANSPDLGGSEDTHAPECISETLESRLLHCQKISFNLLVTMKRELDQ